MLVERHIAIEDIIVPDPERLRRLKKRAKTDGMQVEHVTSNIRLAEHNGGYVLQDGYWRLAIFMIHKIKSITCTVSIA